MRIGLTGTQSVGKSTLVKDLSKYPQFSNYHIAVERSKYLNDLGIKLNTDSTLLGQIIFAAERSTELMYNDVITDRSIYDVCAFTLSANSIEWSIKRQYVELMMNLRNMYDCIIYVSPEGIPIEDNNVRTTDIEYRNKIDYVIKELLKEYPPKKIIEIIGPDNRIENIIKNIN